MRPGCTASSKEMSQQQRWSREHMARGQGHKKNPRPRKGMLEAKAKDQEHNAEVISKKKNNNNNKKVFAPKFRKFSRNFKCSPGKKISSKFFSLALWRSSRPNKIGHDLGPFSTSQKIVLSSSQGQGIFEDLQASRARPRTPNCVLEDSTSAQQSKLVATVSNLTSLRFESHTSLFRDKRVTIQPTGSVN